MILLLPPAFALDFSTLSDSLPLSRYTVILAEDLDGDGLDDVVAGDPYDATGGVMSGAVTVLQGTADWSWGETVLYGEAAGDRFGASMGTAVVLVGDINGDGYGEFVCAAPGDQPDSSRAAGAVYLWAGAEGGLGDLLATWAVPGVSGLAALGDVDGDGRADVGALSASGVSLLLGDGTEVWREEPGTVLISTFL